MNVFERMLVLVVSGLVLGSPLMGYDDSSVEHPDTFYVDDEDSDEVCEEPEPWHHHYHYSEDDVEFNTPSGELDHETAWPGQRVDYSDSLFR